MPWKPRRPRRGHYLPILIPVLDAFDMIGVGVTKGYDLINTRRIDTVLIDRRRYATRESLERLANTGSAVRHDPDVGEDNQPQPPVRTTAGSEEHHDRAK
jgi:hypothetical protein